MPGRGFGAGMFEGLTYLQQRQDALTQQAEEMALRNAMQRLNETEFAHRQSQDALQAEQFNKRQGLDERQFGLQEKQFTSNEEERKYKQGRDAIEDSTGLLKTLLPQGYSGEQMYPITSALRSGDINAFHNAVKGLSSSPLLAEKSKQQWARLESSLQGEELRFFRMTRDVLYNSGGISWDEANHESLIQLQSMRAQRRLSAQGVGATPVAPTPTPQEGVQTPQGANTQPSMPVSAPPLTAPSGIMQPQSLEQFLQGGGGLGTAGRDFGVNARVKAQNESRTAFTAKAKQDMAFREKYDPLRIANAQLAKEGKQLDNAIKRAKAQEFEKTELYRRKMEAIKLKHAVTLEEIAMLNIEQKKKLNIWLKSKGAGSMEELRTRRDADAEAAKIEENRKQLRLELKGVEDIERASRITLARPAPVQQLPDGTVNEKYQTEVDERSWAAHALKTAPAKKQIIQEALNSLNTMRKAINPYVTQEVQKTTPAGKPIQGVGRSTAISAFQGGGTRPNRYNQAKPRKPASQQTTPKKTNAPVYQGKGFKVYKE